MFSRQDLLRNPIGWYPAATVACFDPTTGDLPRRQLDVERTRQFLHRLASAGAPALLIAASTGQGHVRTVEELEAWFQVAADVQLGATRKMALLRPEDGQPANRRLIGLLDDWGFDVVFVRPGTDLPPDAGLSDIVASLQPLVRELAEHGLPVGVYSIPDVSGVRLTAPAAAELVQGPGGDHIVAAKITEAAYELSTFEYLQHPALKHLKIVQGWDPHVAQALQDGPRFDSQGRQRVGITSGPMSFAIHQYLALLQAAHDNDWSEVHHLQQAVTALFAAMQDDPARFADLQRAKYIMGLGQPLTGTVQPAQAERVLRALEQLPRAKDRARLAASLDLMQDGPYHEQLRRWIPA